MMARDALKLIREAKEENLTELDLSYCDLIELPNELFELISLKKLSLYHNKISDLSSLEKLCQLTALDLSNNQISDLSSLEKLCQLTALDLSNNQLSDLSSLEKLSTLTSLYLRSNQLSDLSSLEKLSQLTSLDLRSNQLSDLSSLEKLSTLTSLYLSRNQISDLSSLEKLSQLTTLYLSYNEIRDLSSLEKLSQLTSLDLENNQLSDLSSLEKLSQLTSLDLSSNKIESIKPLLGLIKKGIPIRLNRKYTDTEIAIGDNPLKHPPINIIEQGNQAILTYFQDLENQGAAKLNEAKLIIVGEPDAGKSTLMEKLLDPDYQLTEDLGSTLGIDVREGWQFPRPDNTAMMFSTNIWDFGGQHIQYMTHQFFLTPGSLYVLVSANDRKEATNFPYWFKIIHLLGEEANLYSPVLVLLNAKNDKFIHKFNFDRKLYQQRYPELQIEVCEVDLSKQDHDYHHLRHTIQKMLCQLPHVNDERPARWNDIRTSLRRLGKKHHYIDFAHYSTVCQQHNVNEEASQTLFSRYLHRLGSLIHFIDDPSLSNFIILKPQWAVDAVYSVLSDTEIAKQDGYFSQEKLERIWKNYSLIERGNLLNLMKQENFEICYELENKGHFIAPQLLNDIRPDYHWDSTAALKFRFRYSFMPKVLLPV